MCALLADVIYNFYHSTLTQVTIYAREENEEYFLLWDHVELYLVQFQICELVTPVCITLRIIYWLSDEGIALPMYTAGGFILHLNT